MSKLDLKSNGDLTFYLQRLSLGDVVVRMEELLVFCKHLDITHNVG